MKSLRIVALFSILTLSLALMMTPTVVVGTLPSIDKFWALIISGYPYVYPYEGVEAMYLDPEYMRDVLIEHYPFSEVRLIDYLSYPNQGKNWLRNEIKNWLGSRSDSDDLIFIFFMSHGCRDEDGRPGDPIPGDELDGIDEGFILQEEFVTAGPHYENYWDDEFKEDLATLSYGRLVLLLQGCKVENGTLGCFTGGFIRDLSAPNRIIITPCNETTESYGYYLYPSKIWSHVGHFSRLFINALNKTHTAFDDADASNDDKVSMDEAFTYAYQNDPARIDGRETPQLEDNGDGIVDSYDGLLSMETYFGPDNLRSPDINDNGVVEIIDVYIAARDWGSTPEDPNADMDGNNFINIYDLSFIWRNFGKWYSSTGGTGGTGTPEVSVSPSEIEVHTYQTLSVDVTITNVTDLCCYQFELYYNATVLNCTGVDLPSGHFLEPVIDPSYIFIVRQEYDNAYNATHGRVWVAVTLMSDEPGKNGSGTLVTITFNSTAVGSSTLHFYDTIIGNSVPEAMPVIVVDGSVTVLPSLTVLAEDQYDNSLTSGWIRIDGQWRGTTGSTFTVSMGNHEVFVSNFWKSDNTGYRYGFDYWEDGSTDNPRIITVNLDKTITAHFYKKYCPGDVNGDGVVNVLDQIMVMTNMGPVPPKPPECDVNGDGVVNVLDMVIVQMNMGNVYE